MTPEDWGALLRAYWPIAAAEHGTVHPLCKVDEDAPCPGWATTDMYPNEILLCYGGGGYGEAITKIVHGMRAAGLLDRAPCGSKTCVSCFFVLDTTLRPREALERMSAEERAVHTVLFTAMREGL